MTRQAIRLTETMHDDHGDIIKVETGALFASTTFVVGDEEITMVFQKDDLDKFITMHQKAREVME